MFSQVSLPVLSLIFAAAAAIVWIAGIYVSKTTDVFFAVMLSLSKHL